MVGVPKAQRRQVESHYAGAIVAFVQDCVDAVFGRLRLSDNYIWRVYLTGRYTLVHAQCGPEYLKPGNGGSRRSDLSRAVPACPTCRFARPTTGSSAASRRSQPASRLYHPRRGQNNLASGTATALTASASMARTTTTDAAGLTMFRRRNRLHTDPTARWVGVFGLLLYSIATWTT